MIIKKNKKILFILSITLFLFSLALRLYRMSSIPGNLMCDEADYLQSIYKIIEGEGGVDFFGLGWDGSQPALNTYLMAFFVKLFGYNHSIFAIRFTSALMGTLSVVSFFLFLTLFFSLPTSLFSSILFSSSYWFLNLTRTAWINSYIVFWGIMMFYFFYKKKFLLSSLFVSLCLYGYLAGKVYLLALLLFLLPVFLFHRDKFLDFFKRISIILILSLFFFLPQIATIKNNFDFFIARPKATFIFTDEKRSKAQIFANQTRKVVNGFILINSSFDHNLRYIPNGKPFLNNFSKLLFWGGAIVSLFFFKKTVFIWTIFLVSLLTTQVLTKQIPDGARAIVLIPVYFLFAAIFLEFLLKQLNKYQLWIYVLLALLVFYSVKIDLATYFNWMTSKGTLDAREPAVQLEEFSLWQNTMLKEIRAGKWGFTVGEWRNNIKNISSKEKGL